jgi:hypothetical protein
MSISTRYYVFSLPVSILTHPRRACHHLIYSSTLISNHVLIQTHKCSNKVTELCIYLDYLCFECGVRARALCHLLVSVIRSAQQFVETMPNYGAKRLYNTQTTVMVCSK